MRAVVVERYGEVDSLELREVPVPRPERDEVLVRVHAASLNDWDLAMIRGRPFAARLLHGLTRPRVRTPGCDIAGRVEAVGPGVGTLQVGDEVYGDLCESGFGAFAEYARGPESVLARKPAGMTFEQAAAVPQAAMLAVQGLVDVGRIRAGQRVLLNGAGGGVGTFAVQIAKLRGCEVTAVDKASKLGMLRDMGADRVIDYMQEDFTRSRERYDLILDVKTDRSLRAYARALAPGGTYATVGGDTARLLSVAALGSFAFRWSSKRLRVVALKPNKDLAWVNARFEAGELAPVIVRRYGLEQVADAFRFFATGDHKGKVVLTVA